MSGQAPPTVHRGFFGRAQRVPIGGLYAHARSRNKRLVLCGEPAVQCAPCVCIAQQCSLNMLYACNICFSLLAAKRLVMHAGHSLGGAVATLCALRLMQAAGPDKTLAVRCITFACPPVGNPSLAQWAEDEGWYPNFYHLILPGKSTISGGLYSWTGLRPVIIFKRCDLS